MIKHPSSLALLLGAALLFPIAAFADTTITAAGSTALLPLVKAAAEAYQTEHGDIKISVSGGGSRVGIAQAAAKAVDLGMSDIIASGMPELIDHRVCVIGFAVVAHPAVGVDGLTKKQIQDIFAGKVTNWKEVGGKDEKITVINRPRSSGTRAVFIQTMMAKVPLSDSGLVEDATGTVVSTVKTTPGSVSYAARSGTRNQGLVELKIDGVAPTDDNGEFDLAAFEAMLSPHTRLVAVTHISNVTGALLPIPRIVELAHAHGPKEGALVPVGGRQALPRTVVGGLIGGVVAMLCVAGMIEGFFTPLRFSIPARESVGALTALALAVYFGFAGRER